MCSNYEIPKRSALTRLDVEVGPLDLELKPRHPRKISQRLAQCRQ